MIRARHDNNAAAEVGGNDSDSSSAICSAAITSSTRHTMTLIELLIVLALLGGLATIALTSMGELSARDRGDTTRQRLDAIRTAVVGDGVSPGRFLADMGRLPMAPTTAEGKALSELWDREMVDTKIVYGVANPPSSFDWNGLKNGSTITIPGPGILPTYEKIILFCGWNGPYLIFGKEKLYDGFGNDFFIAKTTAPSNPTKAETETEIANVKAEWEDSPSTGDTVYGVLSVGQDRDFTGKNAAWYDREEFMIFSDMVPVTTLTVQVKMRDYSSSGAVAWTGPAQARPGFWQPDTNYVVGDIILVDNNSGSSQVTNLFRCSTAGKSGSSALSWNFIPDTVTSDGSTTLKWTCVNTLAAVGDCIDHMCVALFVPDVSSSSRQLTWDYDWQNNTASVQATVTLNGGNIPSGASCGQKLYPGLRKLYVYGFLNNNNTPCNAWASGMQTIELKPGANFITVYLTEKLN